MLAWLEQQSRRPSWAGVQPDFDSQLWQQSPSRGGDALQKRFFILLIATSP